MKIQNSIVVLRLNSIEHLPPAKYARQYLISCGLKVNLIEFGLGPRDLTKPSSQNNVMRLHLNLKGRGAAWVSFFSTLVSLLFLFFRQGKPACLVTHGLQEQVLGYVMSKLFSIPLVVHVHEVFLKKELSPTNALLWSWEKTILQHAHFWIVPEKRRAQYLEQQYQLRPGKRAYVPNCPPEGLALNFKPKTPYKMVFVGGIAPGNLLEPVLEALKTSPSWTIELVGWIDPLYQEQLEQRFGSLGRRMQFRGPLGEEKWEVLQSAQVSLCLYSPKLLRYQWAATASNKVMESMAMGTPWLALYREDFLELAKDTGAGFLVEENDLEAGIKSWLSRITPEILEEASRCARKAYLNQYYFEREFQKTLPSFEALVKKESPVLKKRILAPPF